jgi:hypothetical protein
MPGTNKAQIRALASKNSEAVKKGFAPILNIDKFINEEKQHTKWVALSKEELKLHQGPRGGFFRLVQGHKYYGPKNSFENPSQKSIEHFNILKKLKEKFVVVKKEALKAKKVLASKLRKTWKFH